MAKYQPYGKGIIILRDLEEFLRNEEIMDSDPIWYNQQYIYLQQ